MRNGSDLYESALGQGCHPALFLHLYPFLVTNEHNVQYISIHHQTRNSLGIQISFQSPYVHDYALLPLPKQGGHQCTRNPLQPCDLRQCGMESLPNTSTHDQDQELMAPTMVCEKLMSFFNIQNVFYHYFVDNDESY